MSGGRDLRIDFFRGLALIFMFIDHIDRNFLAAYTMQRFFFIDAAEVFIFISGYVSGIVYTKTYLRSGLSACIGKALRRCLRLYIVQTALVLGSGLVLYWFATGGVYVLGREARLYALLDHPVKSVLAALALVYAPGLTGLLPLYILLIASTPFVIHLLRRPGYVLLGSFLIYLVPQFVPALNLYFTYPDVRPWLFNPAAWQFVFVAGLFLGNRRANGARVAPALATRWLAGLSCLAVVSIVLIKCGNSPVLARILHTNCLRDLLGALPDHLPWLHKVEVQPLRLLNLFVLAIVASRLRRSWKFWSMGVPAAVVRLGANSLAVYSVSIVASYIAMGCAVSWSAGPLAFLGLTAAGLLVMHATALAAVQLSRRPVRKGAARHLWSLRISGAPPPAHPTWQSHRQI